MISLYELGNGKPVLLYTVSPQPTLDGSRAMSRDEVIADAEKRFRITGNTHKIVQRGFPVVYVDDVPF